MPIARFDGSALGCEEVELPGEAERPRRQFGRQGYGQHWQSYVQLTRSQSDAAALVGGHFGKHDRVTSLLIWDHALFELIITVNIPDPALRLPVTTAMHQLFPW